MTNIIDTDIRKVIWNAKGRKSEVLRPFLTLQGVQIGVVIIVNFNVRNSGYKQPEAEAAQDKKEAEAAKQKAKACSSPTRVKRGSRPNQKTKKSKNLVH
ncbi:MAG: hypothetical protein IH946_12375 [Bacteroidetes bacterium]|nr:hypothetical protein [Bacteroidota bacterium]